MRLGTLYHGFGGWDIGAEEAGLTPTWGIEWNDKIVAVARENLGKHIHTADITQTHPSDFDKVDWIHASPPCPNFSVAKQGPERGETESDKAHAHSVAEFIDHHQPKVFTLENVVAYRHSESLKIIFEQLESQAYIFDATNICASKMGVPQTRNRLIVRAVKGALLPPIQMHESAGCWLAAIADLVDGLEDTKFAEWQKRRLPKFMTTSQHTHQSRCPQQLAGQSSACIPYSAGEKWRAFIMCGQNGGKSVGYRMETQPFFTVSASQKAVHRASLGNGRIVKINTRCLARWQTFPDWYDLPENKELAGMGIGNAVPCEMARRIAEPLVQMFS